VQSSYRHLLIVANGFRAMGLILGVPSLLVFLSLTTLKIELALSKPNPSTQNQPPIDIGREGIVGVIRGVATIIVTPLELIVKGLDWVAGVVDIIAAVVAVVGACLFFTGRGLALHATWARIFAGLAASGCLLVSLLLMTALRRGAILVALIPIGLSIYMLWVLIRRFN
jgi:hypothetical protein